MVRIMTDSAADFSEREADQRGLLILPLPITFDNQVYLQERDPGFREFYQMLQQSPTIPSTSQATPQDYMERFVDARDAGDELVAITLSSELSSTYQSGLLAKAELGYDGIHVVDGYTAVMGQRILVDVALEMRDQGKSGAEIVRAVIALRNRVRIYAMLDTLEYLKKGGRIPKGVALIGTLMDVKPLIAVRDGKVQMEGRARGIGNGIKKLFELIDKGPKIDRNYPIFFGFANTSTHCERFREEAQVRYNLGDTPMPPIGGVIGTHVGPGATAIAFVEQE